MKSRKVNYENYSFDKNQHTFLSSVNDMFMHVVIGAVDSVD